MTKLEVINNALIHAGSDTLTSLSNVATKGGRLALQQYDLARRNLLSQHNWNFATFREELESEAVAPTFEFKYTYLLPEGFLRLSEVYNHHGAAYQIEGKKLLTDLESPLPLVYVRDMPEPEDWDASFQEAFVYYLASKIVFGLTQEMELSAGLDQFHTRALIRAKWIDSTNRSATRVSADQWVASRYNWSPHKDRFHSFYAHEEPFPR